MKRAKKVDEKDIKENLRKWIAIQLIADSEIRVAAFRTLAGGAPGGTSPRLFGMRAERIFSEAMAEVLRLGRSQEEKKP